MNDMNSKNIKSMDAPRPFQRSKGVKKSVIFMDKMAGRIICIGGVSVIVAVLGILLFLIQQTLPLFLRAKVTKTHSFTLDAFDETILTTGMDDYKSIGFVLTQKGKLRLFHATSGTVLPGIELDMAGKKVSAFAITNNQKHIIFGFSDGSIRFASIDFPAEIISQKNLPVKRDILSHRDSFDGHFIYSKIPGDQIRKISCTFKVEDFIDVTPHQAIISLDYQVTGEAERKNRAFVAVDAENSVFLNSVQTKMNLLTGEKSLVIEKVKLPKLPENISVHSVLMTEKADGVIIADRSGKIFRYNVQDTENPYLAEGSNLLSEDNQLTLIDFLIGSQSIVVGSQKGSLDIYFLSHAKERGTPDEFALIKARSFPSFKHAPVNFSPSMRNKSFAIGLANNEIHILHGTSQKKIAHLKDKRFVNLTAISLSPRLDGLFALNQKGASRLWEFSVPHPETTFKTLFQKVWYEGYPMPTYTWQSSAGTDDYEPKLSLTPLIFGSIKAALYSLLFAIPIAILGAIHTSEFVDNRIKGVVKPAMEMMASLPSVVLGFVAALVLAPIVESFIFAVMLSFAFIPTLLIIASLLWQLLPIHLSFRYEGVPKFILMILFIAAGTYLSIKWAPLFEKTLFNGNFKAWLNKDVGEGTPFLFLIFIPITFFIFSSLFSRYFSLRYQKLLNRMSPISGGMTDIIKWILMTGISLGTALGTAKILTTLGVDVRDGFVGTYVQRNTLIVGFAMGFAVIPIIYTIAEDALSAVPSHLRAASLGCGATPWQTAIYVVLPTAASGVFSAIMVGMGRAVGETMIVVMAAGNTPLMDWNIFNGLRSLSATIAVELPEAVKGGTLYRVLFLSGLVLFSITFIINTIAEIVRIKFRKRAMQL